MSDREPDIIIRASSLWELFDCAARWKAKHLDGLKTPSGSASVIGTATHRGADAFDSAKLVNDPITVSDATDAAADSARNPVGEVRWDDHRPAEAIDIAVRLTQQYCQDISPQFEYRRVETQLDNLDIQADNGVIVRFTGRIDRERVSGEQSGIVDFKTGKQVVAGDGSVKVSVSAAQLGTYELLTLMSDASMGERHLLPAQIVAMPTVKNREPKIATLKKPPHSLLIGDERNMGMIEAAATFFKADMFIGNPRSILCSEKFCPKFNRCHWRIGDEA